MNHYFLSNLVMLFYIVGFILSKSESTNDVKDVDLKPSTKISLNNYVSTPDTWDIPASDSLWVYRPPLRQQSHESREKVSQQEVLNSPHLVTRLAKPFNNGFDPFFNKEYFEPFERRQKPVTLVSFRKNGIQPHKIVKPSSKSSEVAELQSAYNSISTLWLEEPYIYI